MLEEDIQYVEKITNQIQRSGVEGGALMKQLIETLARNLQVIAVIGSSKGCLDLLASFTNVINVSSKRLDTMHEALISGLALAADFNEQGVEKKTPIPEEKRSNIQMDMTPFAAGKAIIKERMSYHEGNKDDS